MNGYVSTIQKFSVNDGYGIRTIVFLLGCPLRCKWCQNPETIGTKPELMFVRGECGNCGRCLAVCPADGPQSRTGAGRGQKTVLDKSRCLGCFRCAEVCPYNALKASGKEMSSDEVFKEVVKDRVFYRNTGGGVTLSGGEPLAQADFSSEILERAKTEGIDTCVETAGCAPWTSFEKTLPFTDLYLFDVKFVDPDLHEKWTGFRNRLIQENLETLASRDKEVIVRIPLIPDVNDGDEFQKIMDRVAELKTIKEVHILPFHQLGSSKYDQLGIAYSMEAHREDNRDGIERCEAHAMRRGFRVSIGGSGFLKGKTF